VDEEQVEREIAALYERPLAQFVEARAGLERRLREAGDARSADRVKRLRKPSLAAWAIDQVSRRDAAGIDELVAMGRELRQAQRRALQGGGGEKMQRTAAERRRLVDRLVEVAGRVLEESGHPASRAQLDRVEQSLLAVATDEGLRERIRRGTLEREASPPSDFGAFADVEATEAAGARGLGPETRRGTGAKSRGGRPPPAEDRSLERARRRADELDRAAVEAEDEARRLRQEARAAQARATKLSATAERAESRAKEARARAARAQREAGSRG